MAGRPSVTDTFFHILKFLPICRRSKGRHHKKNTLPFGHCPGQDRTGPYLIFVIFFTQSKFLENKIYTKKTRTLRQNTQQIANFLRYYGKIHSKLPIFRVNSVKIYTMQIFFTQTPSVVHVTNIRYDGESFHDVVSSWSPI